MISDKCNQSDNGGGGAMADTEIGTTAEAMAPAEAEAMEKCDKSKSNALTNSAKMAADFTQTTARRSSFSEAKANDGQCRKRSNEPIKRKSHEKQHRKSTGEEVIEQRLAALAKENNALKSQLEEQIRLNSVIVANPSLASLGNSNLPRIVFANGTGEQSSPSFGNIMPNFAPFSSDEPPPFCALQKSERSAFSVIRPGANAPVPPGSSQQNGQTDVHTFNAANAFVQPQQNNEFARLAAQLAPFSLFPPTHSLGALFSVPPPQPLQTLGSQSATVFCTPTATTVTVAAADHRPRTVKGETRNGNEINNTAEAQQPQNQFSQMHSNRSSFPNLSMFSSLSGHPIESKTNASSVTDLHNTGEECPLDFSKRGQQKLQHLSSSSSLSSSLAAAMRPKSVIISTSQNDPLASATSNLNLAPAERIGQPSKRDAQAKQQQTMAHKNKMVPKQRSPSSDELRFSAPTDTATGANNGGGHWTPVIQQYKHGPPQQQHHVGTTSSAENENAKQLENVRKNAMEMGEDVTSSSSHLPPPPPLILPHFSSSARPLPSLPNLAGAPSLLQLLLLRGRIAGAIDEHGNLEPPLDLQMDQPTKFADSTTALLPPIISQLVGADSSSNNTKASTNTPNEQHKLDANGENLTSSSSMLGTLLAMPPNGCRTSPTVPASRTEFCSGLALFSSGKNCAKNEPHQMGQNLEQNPNSLHFSSSSTTSNNEKTFANLNSDSEQSSSSGGQNSPNSAHTLHSHTSDSPPSTLPGAGSTMTTVCGSDRTRRGSSSP